MTSGPVSEEASETCISKRPCYACFAYMMLATSSAGRQRSHDPASEKRSLASILREQGPIPVTDAIDIALDVCEELASAHANGIVHGDLGMHRVRTHWPRVPGQRVEIFALGEDDSAAFAFRATSIAGLVAPEQRANRPVDARADVWAVGAMLHWMIAGAAPSAGPAEGTLAKAPRAVSATIEACLAVDPSERPQSVDELAEALASFAASPVSRFEQLAQRRRLYEKAKSVRADLSDLERVLGRLDDAALQRELAAASSSPTDASFVGPLEISVSRSVGSAIFEKSVPMIDLADLADEEDEAETVLAQPGYWSSEARDEAPPSVASPLSVTPVVLSSALLAPAKQPDAASTPATVEPAETVRRSSRPWMMALGIAGAAAALSLGIGIGMRIVERAAGQEPQATSLAQAPVALGDAVLADGTNPARAAVASLPPTAAAAAAAPTSAPSADSKALAPSPTAPSLSPPPSTAEASAPAAPVVFTPDALPDARPVATSGQPILQVATPNALPDAKPFVASVRIAPPKSKSPSQATSEAADDSAANDGETAPAALSDALP